MTDRPLGETTDVIERFFVAYEDDGPSGPCGQDMRTTSPWRRLYEFDNEDDALAFYKLLKSGTWRFRLRSRAVGFWSDSGLYGLVEPGPIVPEDMR